MKTKKITKIFAALFVIIMITISVKQANATRYVINLSAINNSDTVVYCPSCDTIMIIANGGNDNEWHYNDPQIILTHYSDTLLIPNNLNGWIHNYNSITGPKDFLIMPLEVSGENSTITCGSSVTLNTTNNYRGPGTLTFGWSPSTGLNYDTIPDPTSSAIQNTTYYVTVTTPNGCVVTDSVFVTVYPLIANAGTDKTIICGGTAQLDNVTSNYTGTGTLTYEWLPTTGLNNATIPNPTTTATGLTYSVTVTTPNGCNANDSVSVNLMPMDGIEICMVGVDSSNNKNLVVWNKPLSLVIDSFYIYRETDINDVYEKIGEVAYNDMSVFTDTLSQPDIQSNKYEISIKDMCNLESALSNAHKTMHLSINQGVGDVWNLIWENYMGFSVSTYNIYRGTSPANLTLIGSVAGGGATQYTDVSAPAGDIFYQVEVIAPSACNPSKSYNSSRSNIATNTSIGITENINLSDLILIYPNPANDHFTIQFPTEINSSRLELYNIQGTCVMSCIVAGNSITIDLINYSSGYYFVKILNEDSVIVKKILID